MLKKCSWLKEKHVKILGKKSQNLQTQFFSLQFYHFESGGLGI